MSRLYFAKNFNKILFHFLQENSNLRFACGFVIDLLVMTTARTMVCAGLRERFSNKTKVSLIFY